MIINCCRLPVSKKYFYGDVRRSPLFLTIFIFAVLNILFLFQGCATTKIMEIPGTVTTQQNVPFYLTSGDHKIPIKPGNLEIVLIEQTEKSIVSYPTSTWFLQIDTDQGVFVAKFPEGELPGKLHAVGAKQGLSADISISCMDHRENIYDTETIVSCDYSVLCTEYYVETICDDGKCRDYTASRFTTCWEKGTQKAIITTEKYMRSYDVDFLNPQNNTDYYGHFTGRQENLQRELARKPISVCR